MNGPLRRLAGVIAVLFSLLLGASTWVQFVDAESLEDQPTNSRTLYRELGRERGPILVADDPVARSRPSGDDYNFLRTYPAGPEYSHLTGYFSIVYGASGMEAAAGDYLSGTAGQIFFQRIGDLLTGREPAGAAVELTINPRVQKAAWDALGDRRGAVVALDPETGDVLAMVSKPSFDPDDLASHDGREVREAWERLNGAESKPLANRAIGGDLYFPGSVFKLVTSAAALSDGRWTPESEIPGPAALDLPQTSTDLPNDSGAPCGPGDRTTLANALRISCNSAYGWLGLQLGPEALREQAKKFGFDTEGLQIPLAVTPSSVPTELNPPQTAQSAIGQFDVRVTPLQMAMVAAGIANDGVVMKPNLIKAIRGQDLSEISTPDPEPFSEAVTPDVAAQLTSMMQGVVEDGTGTRAQIPGVSVAGKTGSAQTGRGGPPLAWFTSFAPADDPQVAVAVVVEDGGDAASGGRVAAPVAKDVMEAVVRR